MFCTGCGSPTTTDDRFCASCGKAAPSSSAAVSATVGSPSRSIDLHRLAATDLVAGGATVALLLSLLLPWYTLRPNGAVSISIGALVAPAAGFRVLLLLGCVLTLGYLGSRTVGAPGPHWQVPHWQVLGALAGCDAFLALLGIVVRPSGLANGFGTLVGTGIGAYLGLVFAVVALAAAVLRAWQPETVDARSWTSLGSLPAHLVPPMASASSSGPSSATPHTPGERLCPSCATPVDPANQFCTECGTFIVP